MLTNYQDSICAWGYITLCSRCVKEIYERKKQGQPFRNYRHVDIDKEVQGFPLAKRCERCAARR